MFIVPARSTLNFANLCHIPFYLNGIDQYFCVQNIDQWICDTGMGIYDDCNRGLLFYSAKGKKLIFSSFRLFCKDQTLDIRKHFFRLFKFHSSNRSN